MANEREELSVLDIGEIVDTALDAVLATFNSTPEAVEAWEERVMRLAAYDDMLAALKAADKCLSRTLKCRGYAPGSCTDEWSAEVRLEVRTQATVSAAIAAATSRTQPPATPGDDELNLAEGWFLALSDTRGEEIQRDDEAALFPADEDAEAFVRRRATEGSDRHQRAIQRHDDARAELSAEDRSNG